MSDPIACHECRAYYLADREGLVKACETVAGGNRSAASWLLRDYLTGYHESGHDEGYPHTAHTGGTP